MPSPTVLCSVSLPLCASTMRLVGDGETEPRRVFAAARRTASGKPFCRPLQQVFRHAAPRVCDADLRRSRFAVRSERDTALPRVLARVVKQDDQQLAQTHGVRLDPAVSLHLKMKRESVRFKHGLVDGGHGLAQFPYGDCGQFQEIMAGFQSGQVQQFVNHARHPPDLGVDRLHPLHVAGKRFFRVAQQQLHVCRQG